MRKQVFLLSLLFASTSFALPEISVDNLESKDINHSLQLTIQSLEGSKSFQELTSRRPQQAKKLLVQQLQESLKPYGYFQARVTQVSAWHFAVQLNQRVFFNQISVSVEGNQKAYLMAHFQKNNLPKIKKGEPFSSKRYQKAKDKLLEVCERHGFIKARFAKSQVVVDLTAHTANVNLIIQPGKRYYFGDINFSDTVYPNEFLRRYAPFKKGTPFSQEKLFAFEQNLQSTPYFRKVSILPDEKESVFIPLAVTVSDAPKQQYLFGAGFGTDTGVRGRAGLLRLFENGHTLQTELQLSQRENNLQAQYLIPGEVPYKQQTSFNANIFHTNYESGTSDAGLISINRLRNEKTHQFELSLNALYEDYQYTDRQEKHGFFIYPTGRYSRFKRSDPLFSKEGYSLTVQALAASQSLLSDENLFQTSLDLKTAFWLKQTRTRFFLRGTAGLTETSNIYNIPLSLQQLLGGANNLDAYQYQSIGPGEYLLFGRAEIQQEFKEDWFITTSYAVGDVYRPQPFSEKRSIGVGLMYASPIGLVKAGVAKALDLTGEPLKLIFSMGPDL
jgi:translocation and assembly module TamA